MAQTIPDITITPAAWVDINTTSGIAVGSAFTITNKGGEAVYLYEGGTAPAVDSEDGEVLQPEGVRSTGTVEVGSLKIWGRSANTKTCRITVQEV